ncbi:hypothetical protein DTO207G8_3276 [Paecilomyces variotii]|nr:hypothetical protein DTO032I3_2274 [Paecilomyces variotii]KAJ9236264.1 hypothetical protein DTO169E5_5821 [Paecilomyces variotii]KAJ9255092.1 hypothetical protein DTO207G8_3276 [Paecilomyces variotii]KAJ9282012.1 hypothetical protein DTO021D3_1308 [Paecilomyces variotii]KAJ9342015.1 hypothetical protein DTO027B6_5462 [Paecilomyces variotii]
MPSSSFFGHSRHKKDAAKKASVPPTTAQSTPVSIANSSGSSTPNASRFRPRSQSHNGAAASETSSARSAVTANPTEATRKMPNVFEFLEDDGKGNEREPDNNAHSAGRTSHFSEPTRTMPSPQRTLTNGVPPLVGTPTTRVHVDAGVCQREASPGRSSSVASRESAEFQPATPPDMSPAGVHIGLAKEHASNQKLHLAGSYSPVGSLGSPFLGEQTFDLSVPESYYTTPREKPVQCEPLAPLQANVKGSPGSKSDRAKKNKKSPTLSSGYEYLAAKLTPTVNGEKTIPPLYRKFESINHRVLLHLQDEISQMEEDLHILDDYEEMHRIALAKQEGTKPMAASRRMEANAQSYSALHYRRMDLLGKLILKTEQYNNALCSYSKVMQTLPQAPERDIETYRAWMKENCPIVRSETRFLDYNLDLVSLAPRSTTSIYSTMAITAAAILLPLLAFGTISEFIGRLVVVAIVGGAAGVFAAKHASGVEQHVDPQDGWRCAAIYFGCMAVAAIAIP